MLSSIASLPSKLVYSFGNGQAEGDKSMKDILGSKGEGLHQLSKEKFRTPPGFTITAEICRLFEEEQDGVPINPLTKQSDLPDAMWSQIWSALANLEALTGTVFGKQPTHSPLPSASRSSSAFKCPVLIVTVRSGASHSMPGMMDTTMVGVSDEVLPAMIKAGGEWWANDTYRRNIRMFGEVVFDIPRKYFDDLGEEATIDEYKMVFSTHAGIPFPQSAKQQLILAVLAVFRSWNNPRANEYKRITRITDCIGTAVTIQAMVFGNLDDNSGTGVLFTRNPSTGENNIVGEYLPKAVGEDVVSGVRTPHPLEKLHEILPKTYQELIDQVKRLESIQGDMQDVEFTIMSGELYILQRRDGKRTGVAALRIAHDMVNEGLVTREVAVTRLFTPAHADQLLHPQFKNTDSEHYKKNVIAKGIPASPGAGAGYIVFCSERAQAWSAEGKQVVLVRNDTSPEDVAGMAACDAILTARGGMTSHAAVVARGWGKVCVCGAQDSIIVDEASRALVVRLTGEVIQEGTWLSINGTTGEILAGEHETQPIKMTEEFETLINWAQNIGTINVKVNACTPSDLAVARKFGATGVGLCRTERMFYGAERIREVRLVLLSRPGSDEERIAITKLEKLQIQDFLDLFRAAGGVKWIGETTSSGSVTPFEDAIDAPKAPIPITFRLIDPPIHEMIGNVNTWPKSVLRTTAMELGISQKDLKTLGTAVQEHNPMTGWRGCRLEITRPELTRMQVRSILTAAYTAYHENIRLANFEIMLPLISTAPEMTLLKKIVQEEANIFINRMIHMKRDELIDDSIELDCTTYNRQDAINARIPEQILNFKIGAMIETPRACLIAGSIADPRVGGAQFFSFGSNDLTSLTFGISRDDSGGFLNTYLDKKLLPHNIDPFSRIDEEGVGELIRIASERGRKANRTLDIGICGEIGGDTETIQALIRMGAQKVMETETLAGKKRMGSGQLAGSESEQEIIRKLGQGIVNYVSCSPYRVPVAIFAVAQSTVQIRKMMENQNQKSLTTSDKMHVDQPLHSKGFSAKPEYNKLNEPPMKKSSVHSEFPATTTAKPVQIQQSGAPSNN